MTDIEEPFPEILVTQWGCGGDKETVRVLSKANFPTYNVADTNGERDHWGCHLTREATKDEALEYWRNLALNLERKLRDLENKR